MKHAAPLANAKSEEQLAGKMPHERDESVDPVVPPPEPEMKQAGVDVSRGMVDTDRGAAMNVTYNKQKSEAFERSQASGATSLCGKYRPLISKKPQLGVILGEAGDPESLLPQSR